MADPPAYPGAPRWVKISGIFVVVLVLLFLILTFTHGPGGRRHGPGLHAPAGDASGASPSDDGG